MYSDKAKKYLHRKFVLCSTSQMLEISQNFMFFLEYMNFSSRVAPRVLIFLIGVDANYSFEVKNIEIWEPA